MKYGALCQTMYNYGKNIMDLHFTVITQVVSYIPKEEMLHVGKHIDFKELVLQNIKLPYCSWNSCYGSAPWHYAYNPAMYIVIHNPAYKNTASTHIIRLELPNMSILCTLLGHIHCFSV